MSGLFNMLAIETATSSCSVALNVGGRIYERSELGSNVHSTVLLTMVDAVLKESRVTAGELTAVAVGQGPGSFTGLRIGIGVGQGIAYGASCPMIGVSSLDALALQSGVDGHVIAALDARMGELYWCEYTKEGDQLKRLRALQVTPPRGLDSIDCSGGATLVGNAWQEYAGQFATELFDTCERLNEVVYPSATALLNLAEQKYSVKDWVDAANFRPVYVRDDVAKKPKKPT